MPGRETEVEAERHIRSEQWSICFFEWQILKKINSVFLSSIRNTFLTLDAHYSRKVDFFDRKNISKLHPESEISHNSGQK